MKKITYLLLAGVLVLGTLSGCGKKDTQGTEGVSQISQAEQSFAVEVVEPEKEGDAVKPGTEAGTNQVKINVKDYGTITVELDAEHAPITVENFLKLAKDGFYDGLTFHRIMKGFMIQGGDPLGTGMGGSDEMIKGEFSSNGVENPISHTRGTISMARSQQKDSASSQFFIVHEDSTFLDGDYAAFGHVTEGMDVVDKICEDIQAEDNNGTVLAENQPVIESIEVLE